MSASRTTNGRDEGGEFARQYGRWALVAGASEGVGATLADQLAGRGLDLVLIARNEPLLNEVAAGVRERHGVEVRLLVLDLTAADIGAQVAAATDGLEVGLVIYNAGGANRTTLFLEDSFEESLAQIKLVCIGPLALVRYFAPAMRDRGRGGIVLVGSLACLVGAAHVVVYSAVKMFDVNFAEGLWAELRPHGVDVCCAPLGTVYTQALERMGVAYDPARDLLPEDAAREIIENIGNGPTHVVGESNRASAARVWPVDRRLAVEAMSASTRAFATQRQTRH
jgi:short-subunit dehydrogenase